jgi:conserved domain protein
MAKYSFEFKKKIVLDYLDGKGGAQYLYCKIQKSLWQRPMSFVLSSKSLILLKNLILSITAITPAPITTAITKIFNTLTAWVKKSIIYSSSFSSFFSILLYDFTTKFL